MDLAAAAAAQRCSYRQAAVAVASAADDDTCHETNIHHSPLQPTRLFSPSNKHQSTNNNNQNNLTAVNNNDVNNTTVNLKTLSLPRQLSTKEETNLRKLLLFQLNTSRRQRRQRYIENEEDADNLVSYAMEWIMGGESVERVVSELKFIGMSVCGEVEADKIGVALTEFYSTMSGMDNETNDDEQRGCNDVVVTYSDELSSDDIATIKKQLRTKKKRAKEVAAAVKNTNNQSDRSKKKNGGVPPPSPPLGTNSPPSLKKKDGVRLFISPPKSLILSSSSGSPREVIDANVSKDFAFIKDGSVSNIFRIQNQWDEMRNEMENTSTTLPMSDGEEEEFIGYINATEVENDYEDASPRLVQDRVGQLEMWGIKEVSIPIQKQKVSLKSKKNIKNILKKNSTGFYDSSPKKVFEQNSLYVGFGAYPQAQLNNSAGGANTFRAKSHIGKHHVVSQLERAVPPPSVVEVESEAAAAESEATADASDYSIRTSQRPTLTTKELQMSRMNTLNEYVMKIDSMKEELLREIKWQEQKEEQMIRIKTMEEYVSKIDVMKGKLMREITCMKADLEVVCSIDKSHTRQKKEKQKKDEANCVVYQLSCRKCQSRNQHTSFIGSSSLDIKTTIDGHFDRVVEAALQRNGQHKGKCILVNSDSTLNDEDWSNDFAQHFAKHCQRRTRFGSPKRLSKEDVINFCVANIKVEVLGDKKLIYGVANGGKLTTTAVVRKK